MKGEGQVLGYKYIFENIAEDGTIALKAEIPAFPGIVFGDNLSELEEGIKFAIETEIEDLRKANKPIPKPDAVGLDSERTRVMMQSDYANKKSSI